ncbi:uncharacterized protein [Procambarus clarkii]
MLGGCLYHRLDSILPPLMPKINNQMACISEDDTLHTTKLGDQDFSRLEFLSACAIMKDEHTAFRILPKVPHTFYSALFQAVMQKSFYSRGDCLEKARAAMPVLRALTINWPYETMILKELVPPLPLPTSKPQRITLTRLEEKRVKFLEALQAVPEIFIQCKSVKAVRFRGPLCKLDVTGFSLPTTDVHLLKRFVTMAYNPNSPPQYDRSEIMVDVRLDKETESQFEALGIVCTLSRHHGAGLVVTFRKVHITSAPIDCIAHVLQLLGNNGTECLELEMCGLSSGQLASLSYMSKSLTSLSLAYNPTVTSLHFLSQLPRLRELNLSGINVRDKCEPIGSLPQGLQYLKLVGCRLRSPDLQVLSASKHVRSLCHLDLSENCLAAPEEFFLFCKLCENLKKLSVLEVEKCSLHTSGQQLLAQLVAILAEMPKLTFLRMTKNDFSSWIIRTHITCLGNSRSLFVFNCAIGSIS